MKKLKNIAIILLILLVLMLLAIIALQNIKFSNNLESITTENEMYATKLENEISQNSKITNKYSTDFVIENYQYANPSYIETLIFKIRNQNVNLDINDNSTLLIGDSITRYIQRSYELSSAYINNGVPAGTSYDIYQNLDSIYYSLDYDKIDRVFILLGINDYVIEEQYDDYSYQLTVDMILNIANNIHESNSEAEINILNVLPVNSNGSHYFDLDVKNNTAIEINNLLSEQVPEYANYIDLNQYIVDENGYLILSYADDGLHPNKEGYDAIFAAMKEHYNIDFFDDNNP